jgi:uncharacterized repeat protein (TIGR02543 family)
MSTTPINLVELPNNAMVAHNHMWAIYEKNSSGQYVVVSPTKSVPINTPLYAVAGWDAPRPVNPPTTYTVTFNSEGGSTWPPETCNAGQSVLTDLLPVKAGYTFTGWFSAPTGGSQVTSPFTPTGNVTLYAQWTPNALPSPLIRGAYMAPADPSAIATFASLTKTPVNLVVDYIQDNDGWQAVAGASGSIDWLLNAWKVTPYQLCLAVPIIPSDSSGNAVGTLLSGANGSYNAYYTSLAKVLIAAGYAKCYLRLGWEFDGSWYKWAALNPTDQANYAAYFRQIVTTMRAVAGAEFQFIWNPDASAFTQSGYNVELAWPGAQYVDVIGLDLYDFSWSSSTEAGVWVNFLSQMNAADDFATAQGKPLAFCEWGVQALASHGFADDPTYITNMVTWMKSHNVVFEAYFNGDTTKAQDAYLGNYPNSLAAFTKALA